MSLPKINLVVVGHKDHGKSTLIGRLLYDSEAIPEQKLKEIREELKRSGKEFEFAFILDSLEEERNGGLTIDIMHTPFKSDRYFYTIIDCPGHKEFIQKMLTGASQADAAILVVSAVEGIEDQTKQHLYLVKMLGINQLVAAVNKMDIAGYSRERFEEVSKKLTAVLRSLGYEEVPVVPVSAFCGDNVMKRSEKMRWYEGVPLIEVLDRSITPLEPPTGKPLRCFIQDVYELEEGSVIVSKVETGVLKVGAEVQVVPSMERGIVKRIESFAEELKEALPGDSVGLMVDGITAVGRGDVIAAVEEDLELAEEFIAELIIFSDLTLRNGDDVTIRIGTAERKCEIERIIERIDPLDLTVAEESPEVLENGDVGRILFQSAEPIYVENYLSFPQLGRFVVIGKRGATAAGIILEKA